MTRLASYFVIGFVSPRCRSILTGSYNNVFRVFNRDSGLDTALEASRDNIATATHMLEPVNFLTGF